MAETQEQIVREAPEIEAYKLGLLKSAKALADKGVTIPAQMVAEMSQLQIQATDLAQAGIGGYQPYLEQAGYTLGDAQSTIGSTMATASPYQAEAAGLMRDAAGNVTQQVDATQSGIQNAINYGADATQTATGALGTAAENARAQSLAGQTALGSASSQIPTVLQNAQLGNYRALGQAGQAVRAASDQGVGTTLGQSLSGVTDAARAGTSQAGIAALEAARQSQLGTGTAIAGARGITSDAAQALQQAGAFGTQTAQQGIAGLAGATGAYDPASAGAYMNQYEDAAVQQALADIRRAGDIQQLSSDAQAVGAGAFGGSRQGVADAELSRNILEQQGRTAAGMRQQGFESAAQRAQQGFEAQQGRSLQASQLTGALGAQGAQSGIAAAQAAGQLGLSAEQLAAQTAQQGGQLSLSAAQTAGQLGLSGEQMAAANAQAMAQTGMSLQQLQASTGMSAAQLSGQLTSQMGQLGLSGASQQASIAQQAAQMGISTEQLAAQLAGQAGGLGQSQAQLGMQGAQQSGALGMQGSELQSRIGEGIAGLGTSYGQLNLAQGSGQADLGMRQAALGELGQGLQQKETGFLFDLGKQYQAQDQAELEAKRQTQMETLYEPYQRVGFLSDIYKGAPTSQQSITSSTSPSTSPAQQILGLGVAGLSAAAGVGKSGLF